jgi:hypothetical protein
MRAPLLGAFDMILPEVRIVNQQTISAADDAQATVVAGSGTRSLDVAIET